MFGFGFFFLVCIVIVFLLKIISLSLSEYATVQREELRSYECGFEHNGMSRIPFSFRYFFITIIFLLFDLEIVLLFFVAFVIFSSFLLKFLFFLVRFCLVLLVGLFYELREGGLD